MLKDIDIPVVKDIAIAIVPELNNLKEEVWNAYLINLKSEDIEGVLVSSRGYGQVEGVGKKTITFRHFLDVVPAKSYRRIEELIPEVFSLNNEFWLTFYLDKKLYDKKYIFLAESINQDLFSTIPILDKRGVIIK